MRLWIVSARFGVGRGFELFRRSWLRARLDCVDEVRLGACLWIVGAGVGIGARL